MTSVVIPVYDGAAVLPTTIPAVLALDADEVVWVDDGSTDRTPDLLADAAMRSPWARVLTLPDNRGRAAARNAGVAAAAGDVLVFFDADVEPPSAAARALAEAAGAPGALASVARLRPVVTDPSEPYQEYASSFPRGPAPSVPPGAAVDWRFFLTGACAVRRRAFEAAGGFPESVPYGEDVAFGCRLSRLEPRGLRLAGTAVRLHDLGDLDRAVENARQFGASAMALDEVCPAGAAHRLRSARWLAPLASVGASGARALVDRLPPGAARRRAVRYLLAATALRAARRA